MNGLDSAEAARTQRQLKRLRHLVKSLRAMLRQERHQRQAKLHEAVTLLQRDAHARYCALQQENAELRARLVRATDEKHAMEAALDGSRRSAAMILILHAGVRP